MTAPTDESHLIVRHPLDAPDLVAACPPRFTHAHKKLVHAKACPADAPPRGRMVFSRYRAMPLPAEVPAAAPTVEMREDVFGYEPTPSGGPRPVVEWTLNFADPHLFVAYAGPLLAQDELQVLEHPALGSLLEWLRASKDPRFRPLTEEDGAPTPVLVRGVERRCSFATDPDPTEGRPLGLYGNRFSRAREDAIARAVTVLSPPTISNILAIAAPPGGSGRYTEAEIGGILVTAFTGFRAARVESALAAESAEVVIHTGHWGTGAFGGDKVLMTMLQILAARLAGVERVVYHTFDGAGSAAFEEGSRRLSEVMRRAGPGVSEAVRAIHDLGLAWGVSDGN